MINLSKSELEIKKDFSSIYNKPTPYDYLLEMRRLEYRIPDFTSPLYQFLADKIRSHIKQPVKIFDIGSSYGINSALMTFDISMNDLYNFFIRKNPQSITKAANFFAQLPRRHPYLEFYLLDVCNEALKFAKQANFCKEYYSSNLEEETPDKNMQQRLPYIDLFISTGGIGYVGKKTFEKLFRCINTNKNNSATYENIIMPKPIFAFSLLRIFPEEEIKNTFEKNDFVLIKSEVKPLKQRKFYDKTEKNQALSLLRSRGIDTSSLESNGFYYADFFVGGPANHENLIAQWLEQMEKSKLVP